MIFQIFFCLAPNSTFHFTESGNFTIIFKLRSRHDVGGRRKKKKQGLLNFVQLSFTKIYRHLNFIPITSSHHFVSSHHCALISPRLHRWNFPDSKQRPILSPLTLLRRITKRFNHRLIFVLVPAAAGLGGENPRQNENIALEPRVCIGKGKSPAVLEHSHLHRRTPTRPRATTSLLVWHHMDAIAFFFIAVCVSARVTLAGEKFSISKWRPTCFRNFPVWIVGKRFECDASKANFVL